MSPAQSKGVERALNGQSAGVARNVASGHPVTEHLFLTPASGFLNFLPRGNCSTNTSVVTLSTPEVSQMGKSHRRTRLSGCIALRQKRKQDSSPRTAEFRYKEQLPSSCVGRGKGAFRGNSSDSVLGGCIVSKGMSSGACYQSFLSRITAEPSCHPRGGQRGRHLEDSP